MIVLQEIEQKIRNGTLRDQILELNMLIPRMDSIDCLEFMSSGEFLKGLQMGINLVRKAQRLENFIHENEEIDYYLAKLEKLYIDYAISHKNAPN